MNGIIIGTESIREQDGLYSLNDLHRASGGLSIKAPAQFLRLDQVKELIFELCKYAHLDLVKKTKSRWSPTALLVFW